MQISLSLLVLLIAVYFVWKIFFSFLPLYIRTRLTLGKNQMGKTYVALIYKPLTSFRKLMNNSANCNGNSHKFYQNIVIDNPYVKVIFVKTLGLNAMLIVDPELIKKMSTQHVKKLPKRGFFIFRNQVEKGLFFSEGDQWKQSRAIISNLFHFQMIKNRQQLMTTVIQNKISNLHNQNTNIFKLGCAIGGQIVIKSLFGQSFFKVRFGQNNPYQQMQQLVVQMDAATNDVVYALRCLIFGRIQSKSWFISKKQKKILQKLLRFKAISKQFVQKEKQRYQNGQGVAPFLQAFFNKNDDKYLDQLIHHLFVFVIAGQDTTGSLIQICLAHLSMYPQYQQKILVDTAAHGIHNSNILNDFINQVNRATAPIQLSSLRRVAEQFQINKFIFPKGTIIMYSYGIPMINSLYWDKPFQFNPERKLNPPAYLPFSTGPRNCIGQHMALMQIRIALVHILQKYQIIRKGLSYRTKMVGIVNPLTDSYFVTFKQH